MPPDIEAVARQIDGGPFAGILFGAAQGIERAYPGMRVREFLNEEGRALYDRISDMCVSDLSREGQFTRIADVSIGSRPTRAAAGRSACSIETTSGGATPTAPLYLYHAILDELIPIKAVDELVAEVLRRGRRRPVPSATPPPSTSRSSRAARPAGARSTSPTASRATPPPSSC